MTLTTIGYGDVIPQTNEERIVAMVRAAVRAAPYPYACGRPPTPDYGSMHCMHGVACIALRPKAPARGNQTLTAANRPSECRHAAGVVGTRLPRGWHAAGTWVWRGLGGTHAGADVDRRVAVCVHDLVDHIARQVWHGIVSITGTVSHPTRPGIASQPARYRIPPGTVSYPTRHGIVSHPARYRIPPGMAWNPNRSHWACWSSAPTKPRP